MTKQSQMMSVLSQIVKDNEILKEELTSIKMKIKENSNETNTSPNSLHSEKDEVFTINHETNPKVFVGVKEQLREQISKLIQEKISIKKENDALKHELILTRAKERQTSSEYSKLSTDNDKKISTFKTQKESLHNFVENKNEIILDLKSNMAKIYENRLLLRQENDMLKIEIQKAKSIEISVLKELQKKESEAHHTKLFYEGLIQKNIDELKQKDTRILSQGQELLSLKSIIGDRINMQKNMQNTIITKTAESEQLKEQVKILNKLLVTKDEELKSISNGSNEEIISYKKIIEDLKMTNSQLLFNMKKYSDQIERYKLKLQETFKSKEKASEEMELDEKTKDQFSIEIYDLNKELEILKQTILELTHKLKIRKSEEAKMLLEKNKEFDEKTRALTESHAKKELELEYKIEDKNSENAVLKSDIQRLKDKEKQFLEKITEQFSNMM
ncbi:MAG: hypothetical protein WC755_05770 [Candidatus Woesearchaeota archaeon]|jgi:hypothetical protein